MLTVFESLWMKVAFVAVSVLLLAAAGFMLVRPAYRFHQTMQARAAQVEQQGAADVLRAARRL